MCDTHFIHIIVNDVTVLPPNSTRYVTEPSDMHYVFVADPTQCIRVGVLFK